MIGTKNLLVQLLKMNNIKNSPIFCASRLKQSALKIVFLVPIG
jgi:hypothetical protein